MNDKQQSSAMGAELSLTEEQAKAMAERMPQTGTLKILDDEPLCTEIRINGVESCGADIGGLLDRCLPHTTEQKPLCMAKRIEELEAQVREMAGLLREGLDAGDPDYYYGSDLMRRIEGALASKLPEPAMPEGWKLVEKANCFVLIHDGQVIASMVGPTAECVAEILASVLDVRLSNQGDSNE